MGYGMDEDWGTAMADDHMFQEKMDDEIQRRGLTEKMIDCHHPFFKAGVCVLCKCTRANKEYSLYVSRWRED